LSKSAISFIVTPSVGVTISFSSIYIRWVSGPETPP
jgi:hypothetical protein